MRIERTSLTDQIAEAIRSYIATGELSPHERHSVQSITDRVQRASDTTVSRTPVREALVRLAEAGMVRFVRNRGIQILRPGLRDLKEIFQLRLMLEPTAAFRAASRVDEGALRQLRRHLDEMASAAAAEDFHRFMDHDIAFHGLILRVDGNERLIRLVRNLRDATRALGLESLLEGAAVLRDVMREHVPVFTALRERDPEGARKAMYEHVEQTGRLLLRQLQGDSEQEGLLDGWSEGVLAPTRLSTEGA